MPQLSDAEWGKLKAEWDRGELSERALAEKYGIDKKALYKRKTQECWTVPGASNIVPFAAVTPLANKVGRIFEEKLSEVPEKSPEKSPANPRGPSTKARTVKGQAGSAFVEAVREAAVQTLMESCASDLQRAADLKVLFNAYKGLIADVMLGDEQVAGKAAERIMAGKDTLSGAVSTLTRLHESIQTTERKALGIADRTNVGITMGEAAGVLKNDGDRPVIDATQFTSDQLAMMQALATRLDEQKGNELPLPPKGPQD